MSHNKPRLIKRHSLLLIIIGAMFLFNISISLASEPSVSEISDDTSFTSVSTVNEASRVKNFNDLYDSIMKNTDLDSSTIVLNGNVNNMIKLPGNSTIVRLPNERIALKYSDEDMGVLPDGSSVSYQDDNVFVLIPDQDTVLSVSEVVTLPIEDITKTATYDQSINRLDRYKVEITFNELNNPDLSDNINSYSINWGDGNADAFNADESTAAHTYKKSGNYEITVNVVDDFGFTHSIKKDYGVKYEGHLTHAYFLLDENKEPVAVTTSTGASLLAVGLVAFTETGKYKFLALLPLLIPMYTRIQKEDVLDQFVRGQIYGYIKTNPGVHYNQIRRGIDVKNGTLSYHLSVLEKTELIKSRREGVRYRAFYPTGMKFPKNERFRLNELQIGILDIIKENNGITQKEIANKLGKKPQTINYNIKVLEQAGLIEVIKEGRKTVCYPKDIDCSDKPAE